MCGPVSFYGSHTIFVRVVEEVLANGAVGPLLYLDGRYIVVRLAG
jgi:hypothetical protein